MTLKTKFGNAKIEKGYYKITSRKEGNKGKLLHRLIWEDFYGKSIPNGYSIHHKDGNPLNNEIWNLQCCENSKHMRFHAINISDEKRLKMSQYFSGDNNPCWKKYARIIKDGHTNYGKQLYCIRFDGKRIKSSIDIYKLINWFNEVYPSEPLYINV